MMSDRSLVDAYMAGGNVTPILNKMVQENVDPAEMNAIIKSLDKASAVKEGHNSITEGEVFAVQTFGTIEQLKGKFTQKCMENGDTDTIKPLSEQQVKLYCMINANKEYPLKAQSTERTASAAQKPLNPALMQKLSEKTQG